MEVDHPNIVKFYQVYRDKKYFHIVMELCNGEELFEHLTLIGKFSEADAAKIIKQILSAIKHLHDKNIAHRDLKPENIIFMHTHDKNEINIKLIDFGLSKILSKDKRIMMTKLGTPYYVSPEVLEGIYDKRCDIWAVGVIAYILLSGTPPFNGRNEIEVFNKIRCCDYEFPEKLWSYISEDAKDFISKLLHPEPDKRMTAE
jgi:calcium-dependent protein kinase